MTGSNRTVLTTASGRHVDLLAPTASDIDPRVVAEHLSKENRYSGATRGVAYSVAEHSVRCAQAAIDDGHGPHVAAYVFLHDWHEFVLKDDTTPKKRAIAAIAEQRFGVLAASILDAFAELTARWDEAIHQAAGLPWPLPPGVQHLVHHYDRALLATEWRDLMRCAPPYDLGAEPLPAVIEPWVRQRAQREFEETCGLLLPTVWSAA